MTIGSDKKAKRRAMHLDTIEEEGRVEKEREKVVRERA